ncbi:secretion system protein [Halapricum hydrolyticum]|uniref:Secretion system protein n=1 Tax=Halapricum hydrolyticum TaxID=2979991 RepID=A0AAE3LJ35_9EURY|nr:secretion system protein [Halapricum hydrolyticum]MCU4717769.1 secretion system protein [Halapricum hydrolyticum]MCU4726933.1 secretion system protein [Halapricum hydrolyticum]
MLVAIIELLALLAPVDAEPSDELAYAVAFIEAPYDPETVVRAGYGAGIVGVVSGVGLFASVPTPPLVAVLVTLALALGSVHAVHELPALLAAFKRARALGDAPNLIGRAVLRMEIHPATETAVAFAAETGRGPLSASLQSSIDRAMGTPQTGLIEFAENWADDFPALRRAAHLLSTAENAPDGERARTLDRSLEAILDGTREQMADFTNAIRGPTTGLYAFGVMIPMAAIALVPAAAMAGVPVSVWAFVVLYDVVLPAVLIGASVWLLVRRPVAFPPPRVDRSHPDVPDRLWLPFVIGPVVGAIGYVVPSLFGVGYLSPVAGGGMGVGGFLLSYFDPITDVREYVRNVEAHLTDALYLVGRQVSEGEAVEAALGQAGDRVPAETGAVFERAAGVQKRLHLTVEEAFFGEYGALRDIPSARAHGTASLLSIAAEEGQPAGRAVVSMADHLEELQEVESEARRQLSTVTGTLDTTAAYFGPLIAGTVLALADVIGTTDSVGQFGAEPLATEPLGLVVGVYVLIMSVVLTTLSVGLRHGLDRPLVGYRVGRSLLTAMPLYVGSVVLVGQLM